MPPVNLSEFIPSELMDEINSAARGRSSPFSGFVRASPITSKTFISLGFISSLLKSVRIIFFISHSGTRPRIHSGHIDQINVDPKMGLVDLVSLEKLAQRALGHPKFLFFDSGGFWSNLAA